MKALQFDRTGSLDHLRMVDVPRPIPRAGEALIEVRAAGLNPSDVKNVLGRFPYTTLPRIPGRDFAGTVVEGPPDWTGRDVWGTGRDLGFFRDGSHADYLTLPITGLSRMPAALSFVQAASCGVPFTTALDALDRCGVNAGTHLLVIGAAGAVGGAAIQLAAQRGSHVVAAVRRREQQAALDKAGFATLLIDAPEALIRAFNGGADVVFDTTGFWLPESVAALAPLGRIAVIAAPADGRVSLSVLDLYRRGGSIVGINSLLHDSAACAAMLSSLASGFDKGELRPLSELKSMPLARGHEAYEMTNSGGTPKIVLQPAAARTAG